jgi:hypothetical protein
LFPRGERLEGVRGAGAELGEGRIRSTIQRYFACIGAMDEESWLGLHRRASAQQEEPSLAPGGMVAPLRPGAISEAARSQLLTRALSQDEKLDFLKSFVAREKGAAVADALRSLDRPVTLTARNPYVAGRAYLSGNNVSWNPEHNLFLVLALPPEAERPNSIAVAHQAVPVSRPQGAASCDGSSPATRSSRSPLGPQEQLGPRALGELIPLLAAEGTA